MYKESTGRLLLGLVQLCTGLLVVYEPVGIGILDLRPLF